MTWQAGLAVAAAAVTIGGDGGEPLPLQGVALTQTSGLRLLVADNPPFVLDADAGSITRVRGVAVLERGGVSVVGVGGRSGVVLADSSAEADVLAVTGRPPRASRLGKALAVVPAPNGRAVWLKSRVGRGCALRQVQLDGTTSGARYALPCSWTIQDGGSLGVIARRTQVLDPRTGRTVFRARWGVLAAVGARLVLKGPGQMLALVDARSGREQRLRWPSVAGALDAPAVDPRGRFVALAFADPAWSDMFGNTAGQVLDVWLLDTTTAGLTHVPGMPAFVGLKRTSMEWTADGRLVLLAESEGRDVVAVWRPGQDRLALKTVRLPERSGYSDSFAPLG